MAEKIKKLEDGTLEITVTGDMNITTMTREEVVGRIAEVQTKLDHLNIDVDTVQTELTKWDNRLKELDKEI